MREARALGIVAGSPLFLDMEAYNAGNAACARTTLDFVRAWNREVRGRGYLPGFYSSADSGVRQMEQARQAGVGDLPAVIWFARWHTGPGCTRSRRCARTPGSTSASTSTRVTRRRRTADTAWSWTATRSTRRSPGSASEVEIPSGLNPGGSFRGRCPGEALPRPRPRTEREP